MSSMQTELSKTSEDTSEKSANIEAFTKRLGEIEKERQEKQARFSELQDQQEGLKEQISVLEESQEKQKEELSGVNRTLDAKQNEYNLPKSLVDNLEGFPEAIKFLKKNPQWKEAPLLSDVITCPEKYRVTIENFLEPFMNYYIVDAKQDALEAVHLLTEASRGKANFFVLDSLESCKQDSLSAPSDSQSALDLVEYDTKYENLIKHLLGYVFITTDHENHLTTF